MTELAHAIAIEPDAGVRSFIADALATFEPGFRVATCIDLDAASRRMALRRPDVVILRPGALGSSAVNEWLGVHGIPNQQLITIGSSDVSSAATLAEPVSLTALIRAAREVASAAGEYDRPSGDVARLQAMQG